MLEIIVGLAVLYILKDKGKGTEPDCVIAPYFTHEPNNGDESDLYYDWADSPGETDEDILYGCDGP